MSRSFNGVIRWFSRRKGYGFIDSENFEKDVFVHCTGILDYKKIYKTLGRGTHVSFHVETEEQGFVAKDVTVCK